MTLITTDDKELCDYDRLKQYLLLESLIPTFIPQEIREELEDMIKPAYFGIEFVTQDLSKHIFYDEFQKILGESAGIFGSSEIECAKFLISRCIRLCDEPEPTYFNFLLVATFLKESIFHFFLVYKCYRILYIADFCFNVLYNRLFWKLFESREVYENLEFFCNKFLEHFTPDTTQGEFQGSNFGKYCIHFVEERFHVNNDSFSLKESEVELFETFYSMESIAKREEWQEMRETENSESAHFDAREHYPFECETCGSKCSDYLNCINFL
ncbi:hypothetical protein TNIN_280831 [Trichonephila inaurata madagascariensis]|uniref:Uncharacterized protein n=1 Tax=Trichonephila inaurata madagascariensis TaxID=2747483 RepID=A0A8X6MFM1_9ARAC|nr:hypothetical protein TNIN_280831 [Trichonephila inaurata madagascariensis]